MMSSPDSLESLAFHADFAAAIHGNAQTGDYRLSPLVSWVISSLT